MAGNKTHDQQLRIIEKRVNTKNADDEFDAEDDLKRSERERKALQDGGEPTRRHVDLVDPDDREMIRGVNQESRHHKRSAND